MLWINDWLPAPDPSLAVPSPSSVRTEARPTGSGRPSIRPHPVTHSDADGRGARPQAVQFPRAAWLACACSVWIRSGRATIGRGSDRNSKSGLRQPSSPAMVLRISISAQAESSLIREASATGRSPDSVAAEIVERAFARASTAGKSGANGRGPADDAARDRATRFMEWVSTLQRRPGPPVDASRDSIYD